MRNLTLVIIVVCLLQINSTQAQVDLNTNGFVTKGSSVPKTFKKSSSQAGITCLQNVFYAVDAQYITRLSGSSNSVTILDTVMAFNGLSLAIGDHSGSFTPTYYSETFNGFHPQFFNGSQWSPFVTDSLLYNCGAYGNYLYYMSDSNRVISKISGGIVTPFYKRTQGRLAVADIAVDPSGSLYLLTTPTKSGFMSDSIIVLSSTGQVLVHQPYVKNCLHAYGSFFDNGVFYIGFGPQNTVTPNSLLPIVVQNGVVVTLPVISMPALNYYDLASCSESNPVGIHKNFEPINFSVYPSPATGAVFLNFDSPAVRNIKIIDLVGKVIFSNEVFTTKEKLNVNDYPPGIYFISVEEFSSGKTFVRKFVIE